MVFAAADRGLQYRLVRILRIGLALHWLSGILGGRLSSACKQTGWQCRTTSVAFWTASGQVAL